MIPAGYRHGRGWKRPSVDPGFTSHRHRIAGTPVAQQYPTMTRFRGPQIWQGQVGECVGASTENCDTQFQLANSPDQPLERISALGAYILGMRQAYAGTAPELLPPLSDEGSEPGLVLLAAQNVGLIARDDMPSPDHPDFDPENFLVEPNPDALVRAWDARGLQFFNLPAKDSNAGVAGFRQACRDALLRFHPVMVALNADSDQYQHNLGEVITDLGPNPADHMNAMLDATDDTLVTMNNWWRNDAQGIPWGDPTGAYRITWTALYHSVEQALAVTSAPRIRKAA